MAVNEVGMVTFYWLIALVLLLTMFAGLWRVMRGPTLADRMLAAQLLGTAGVAILLLIAQAQASQALRDVALVFALLAAVSGIAFVRLLAVKSNKGKVDDH